MVLNCQGLNREKCDLLHSEYLRVLTNINFICVTETWCCTDSIDAIFFPGFVKVSCFCRKVFKHGGVGIWCRSELVTKCVSLEAYCVEKEFEICGSSWKDDSGNRNTLILVCYRSPDSSNFETFLKKLNIVLSKVYKPQLNLILTGDFNVDPNRDKVMYKQLIDILVSFDLNNDVIHQKTRGEYVLDHFFTNLVNPTSFVFENTFSDHNTILVKTDSCNEEQLHFLRENKRIFSESNISHFINDLCLED